LSEANSEKKEKGKKSHLPFKHGKKEVLRARERPSKEKGWLEDPIDKNQNVRDKGGGGKSFY